ncbi:related to glycolate oxidase [Phialocephala subalpina]|uniref:Related to glycolate oxidase n=1 Tax=Phialocephala subalpina TaxID=576137 RepID=A0A1L7WTQ6_9HELO|nr:related to glycolate oxidase [Phialocephala subalpina]
MEDRPVVKSMGKEVVLSINDIQEQANKKLPKLKREFFNSGSTAQQAVHENSTAFAKYRLRPRVLRNVANVDTGTTVLGSKISFPLCVSPAGIQAMAHPDGELATSRACAKRGINMGVSSFANYSIEEITKAGFEVRPIKYVMQLYTMKDREMQVRIIKRAEAVGCVAIFLTGDSPVLGVWYNEWRNDFRTPDGLGFPMIEKTSEQIITTTHDDSNHGGRQLDETPATIDALPECVKAAEGKIRFHIDGGFRTGQEILKALAWGAECCWIGRLAIWGLAYDGQAGVDKALDIIYDEFRQYIILCRYKNVSEISKTCLGVVRADGPLARL